MTVQVDEFGKTIVEKLTADITERNSLVKLVLAAQGDKQAMLETLRENPPADHAKLAAAMEAAYSQYEKLSAQLNEKLAPVVDERMVAGAANSEADAAKLDAIDKVVKSGLTYLKNSYGDEIVNDLPEVLNRKNRSSGDGEGNGGRRIRGFDVSVDGKLVTIKDGKNVERSNLAAAAKATGVDTATIQTKFFEAQETKDVADFKERVEFTVNGKDDTTFTVTCVRVSAEATIQEGEKPAATAAA